MSRAYLDHNATAPLRPEARRAVESGLQLAAANPSSAHREGRALRGVIDRARREVAAFLGARPHEIVFTSSGTEAANLALQGSAFVLKSRGRRIAALAIEHPAVLEPLEALAADEWTVDLVPVGASGAVSLEAVEAVLKPDTVLLACMWANNETGIVQPIAEIAALCASRGVRLFVDAVQAAGRIPLDMKSIPVDLLAISSHKVGGPVGAGALYVREGTALAAHVVGGGQESGLRGGTENALSLAGFGAAAAASKLALSEEMNHSAALRARLIERIGEALPAARVVGTGESIPNTVQLLVPHDDEEMLILALDRAGFAVSAGSACAAGAHRPSHVLAAMGVRPDGWSAVRVSVGPENTAAEMDGFAAALAGCVQPAAAGEAVR
jgi:cysteine desulfurase